MNPSTEPAYNPKTYWERRLAGGPTLALVGYAGCGPGYNRWLYQLRRITLERALKRHPILASDTSLLEIGTGSGFYLPIWQRHGVKRLLGVDITEAAISQARKSWPQYAFQEADIAADPSPVREDFDVVTAFDVLFHLPDDGTWSNAMRNIAAAVRPGGWLLLTDGLSSATHLREAHHKVRNVESYRRALEPAFEMVDRIPIFVLMLPPFRRQGAVDAAAACVWRGVAASLRLGDRLGMKTVMGHLAGCCLYPADAVLNRFLRSGPSMEMLICRRRR